MFPACTISERLDYLESKGWRVVARVVGYGMVQRVLWSPENEAVVELPLSIQDRSLHLLLDRNKVPNVGE